MQHTIFVILGIAIATIVSGMPDEGVSSCFECPGNCDFTRTNQPIVNFDPPTPVYDGGQYFKIQQNMYAETFPGTSTNPGDPDRFVLEASGFSTLGCFIFGLKDTSNPNAPEQFAVLSVDPNALQVECQKTFKMPYKTTTKMRVWKVSPAACPEGMKQ